VYTKFFTIGISLNGQTKNQNVEEHIEIWVLKKTMQIKRKKNSLKYIKFIKKHHEEVMRKQSIGVGHLM
jgi:hypothetical protein